MFGKGRKRTRNESGGPAHLRGSRAHVKQQAHQHVPKKKRTSTLGEVDRIEEERLEKLVFGNASDVIAKLDSDDELLDLDFNDVDEASQVPVQTTSRNIKDQLHLSSAISDGDSGVDEGGFSPLSDGEGPVSRREPVWMDEDDDNVMIKDALHSQSRTIPELSQSQEPYSGMLKRKYEAVVGTPRWADLSNTAHQKSDPDSDEEDAMQHSGPFLHNRLQVLGKGMLGLKHLKDLNSDSCAEGIITSTDFHPTSTVALIAGLNGAVSIVQVDGKTNTKLQTIQFERFPVRCAHFSRDGTQFIVGSQHHSYFYVYDMMEGRSLRVPFSQCSEMTSMKKFSVSPDGRFLAVPGKFGHIHLLSAHSKEWIGSLKMNAEVKTLTFNKDGSHLYSHGESGEVYIWDMNSRECIHRFTDDGCIVGTSLAVSPSGQYLACGSSSGVVNIYEGSKVFASAAPRPLKIALNLVTPVTSLSFNASSELLAMASVEKDNATKLMHFPSMTVFSNFPVMRESMARIQCLDFSPNSGFLSFGNNRGRAMLYRLMHYKNY